MIRICIRPVSAFVALALSLGVALPALGGSPFLDDDDEEKDAAEADIESGEFCHDGASLGRGRTAGFQGWAGCARFSGAATSGKWSS